MSGNYYEGVSASTLCDERTFPTSRPQSSSKLRTETAMSRLTTHSVNWMNRREPRIHYREPLETSKQKLLITTKTSKRNPYNLKGPSEPRSKPQIN